VNTIHPAMMQATQAAAPSESPLETLSKPDAANPEDQEAKETFDSILGELMFHEMLKSMRRTVDEAAYFHGGHAEEVFTSRLDQILAQKLGETSGEQFLGPMYDAWSTARR
jgi:Rod binding domain-containing protein